MNRTFWKGARASVYSLFFTAGGIFWIMSHSGNFNMSVEVYGATIIDVPAEYWAGLLFVPSVFYLAALYINVRRRWTPLVRLICGFLVMLKFSAFAVSSLTAPFGDIVTIWSVVLGGMAIVLACVDGIEFARQMRGKAGDI